MELPFNIHVNFFSCKLNVYMCSESLRESVFHLERDDRTALHLHIPVILEFLK